jgi:hypothetical protein
VENQPVKHSVAIDSTAISLRFRRDTSLGFGQRWENYDDVWSGEELAGACRLLYLLIKTS